MKIEPMIVDKLRVNLPHLFGILSRDRDKLTVTTARVALEIAFAWAHERARAEWYEADSKGEIECLNEVLDEIGWPKDQR